MAFSPVQASKDLSQKYERYLSTIFSLSDPEYERQFRKKLQEMPFANGPFLETTDAFEAGESVRDLISSGVLPSGFDRLRFHVDRPLYLHQVEAIHLIASGKNAVVSTGTGSGKTESFLLPIMKSLVEEYNAGTLSQQGVRALLIYPMNALANDQIERLRELLADYPEITFGAYTGQTQEGYNEALAGYKSLNEGRMPLQNELICRKQMKEAPPHLLITNYAMLEYLMVRPDDSVFFAQSNSQRWHYIVLDEAHVYKGATGIEVSMLLRRLKAKLAADGIQYILTSATLGAEDDNAAVAQFASNLCDSPFSAKDVIRAKRRILTPPLACKAPPPDFYPTVAQYINRDASSRELMDLLQAYTAKVEQTAEETLYAIVYTDPLYWRIRSLLQKPRTVCTLMRELSLSEQELSDFVTVATRAVKDGAKLFDARYHLFVRAAESVFVTLGPVKRVFLEGRKEYEEDGVAYKVFEIATCSHCHAMFILGKEDDHGILNQTSYTSDEEPRCVYLVANAVSDSDDEHTLEDEGEETEPFDLCAVCGKLTRAGTKHTCDHSANMFLRVQRVELREGKTTLTKCPACETVSSTGILRQFFVGQEAVTSVLGTALFESLPSYTAEHILRDKKSQEDDFDDFDDEPIEETVKKDIGAKQFIAFSDNRQAAAFYASYLSQTYSGIVNKRLILETLKRPVYQSVGKSMDDFVEDLIGEFEKHHMADRANSRKEAWKAALHELIDNNGNTSLYKLGLISFDIGDRTIRGSKKYDINLEEMHEICALFADWMMSEGAIDYPEVMNYEEKCTFAPNGIEHSYTLSDSDAKKNMLSFLPSRQGYQNKRTDYLTRVLKAKNTFLSEESTLQFAEGLWNKILTAPDGILQNQSGTYKLKSKEITIRHAASMYRCPKCHRVTPHNVAGICPTYRCSGVLNDFDPKTMLKDDHYYNLYQQIEIRPLRVVEHTAQLNRETAYEYQKQFKQKQIDILSCSTTFEMGVDVGSLETVFMRNVPPSPANYAQRAGRAGRSINSAAFALTFCNKSNHDFSFFRDPERMIKGRIDPPVFDIDNPKIAIRHVYASAFSFFWKEHPQYFSNVASFMEKDTDGNSGVDMFCSYLKKHPPRLKQYLEEFLPIGLAKEFNVENFGWTDALTNEEDGILVKAIEAYHEDIDQLTAEASKAFAEKRGGVDNLNQRIRVYQREAILAYLARKNIFPKYGFPVDTVEMTIIERNTSNRVGLQLQRDLSMAISEYAPGSQIVANGRLITSRYIRKQADRSWKMSRYCICKNCRDMNIQQYISDNDFLSKNCQNCGAGLERTSGGVFIIPEFGFEADGNSIKKPSLRKPARTYKSEVSYIGSGEPIDAETFAIGAAGITVHSGKNEELAVINQSHFFVCESCGYTELDEKRFFYEMKCPHKRSRGSNCHNTVLKRFALAYRFRTDVFSMRFDSPGVFEFNQAISLLYGILEGCSRVLNVERNDISGCVRWFYNKELSQPSYEFVFYDKTPGGAGHVRRMDDRTTLEKVLRETLFFVSSCSCGGSSMNTSCYSCLRNYYNQKYHENLQRKYVVEFLSSVLSLL